MSRGRGRIALTLLFCLCLVPLFTLGLHQTCLSLGQSNLVRQQLTEALAQLPTQPPAAPAGEPSGRAATAVEAAGMDSVVNGFLTALRAHDLEAAWELVTAEGIGPDSRAQWEHALEGQDRPAQLDPREVMLLQGRQLRVTEVKTRRGEGVARLVLTARPVLWLQLVRQGEQWLVASAATEQRTAAGEVQKQVDMVSSAGFMGLVMAMDPPEEGLPGQLLRLLLMVPESVRVMVSEHRVQGQVAWVKLEAEARFDVMASLRQSGRGWQLSAGTRFTLLPPDAPLKLEAAPRRRGEIANACLSNLRSLSLGMQVYLEDYDHFYPPAQKWSSALGPFDRTPLHYHCPAVPDKFGYAMNYKLSGWYAGKLSQPPSTVTLFDSTLLRPNAFDVGRLPGASVPIPPRHDNVICYAYTDGHAGASPRPLDLGYFRPVRTPAQMMKPPAHVNPGGG